MGDASDVVDFALANTTEEEEWSECGYGERGDSQPHTHRHREVVQLGDQTFNVNARYHITGLLGNGAYGVVVKARDTLEDRDVAIKKCVGIFRSRVIATRSLREIKLLQFLDHENVVKILDLDIPSDLDNFQDLYIVLEMVPANLESVIQSSFEYSLEHIQFFFHQLCQAMQYVHAANVLHRDLKSSNVLVSLDCDVKLCDFGLARDDCSHHHHKTEYTVSRFWRPPEILLRDPQYSKAADVWSAGLIFLELFNRRPIFRGQNSEHQLRLICDQYWGTPCEEDFTDGAHVELVNQLLQTPPSSRKNIRSLLSNPNLVMSPEAADLAERMLQFHPAKRISFEEALLHPYFSDLELPPEISETVEQFSTEYEEDAHTEEAMRALFLQEISNFHPEIIPFLADRLYCGNEVPFDVDRFPALQNFLEHGGRTRGEGDPLQLHPYPFQEESTPMSMPVCGDSAEVFVEDAGQAPSCAVSEQNGVCAIGEHSGCDFGWGGESPQLFNCLPENMFGEDSMDVDYEDGS